MYFKSGSAALMLAAYTLRHQTSCETFVELGSGEGFSSQIVASRFPKAQGLLVDSNPFALNNAQENILSNLGYLCHDLEQRKEFRKKCAQLGFLQVDIVLTNPPYHKAGGGRSSQKQERNVALRQDTNTLEIFCQCARDLLRHHGHFFVIYDPAQLAELLHTVSACGFGLRSLLPIHTRSHKNAEWVLLWARKGAKNDLDLEASLCLYAQEKGNNYSYEALSFCPWLIK